MNATKLWAESLKVSGDPDLTPVADFSKPYARTARQVAARAIVLQGVSAVAYEVEAQSIVEWFQAQDIWSDVTPQERAFILGSARTESEKLRCGVDAPLDDSARRLAWSSNTLLRYTASRG
jgi:hypothetical protein